MQLQTGSVDRKKTMNGNDILKLGYSPGKVVGLALAAAESAQAAGASETDVRGTLVNILSLPDSYKDDPIYGPVATIVISQRSKRPDYELETAAPYRVWGSEIEPEAMEQMKRAVRLPVAVRGALMPDAHQGYGLPIGGVLATENSVIPYAVGVDIACRMRMTVFDVSPYVLEQKREKFRRILEDNTRFGTGAAWREHQEHEVMDNPAWRELPVVRQLKDKAWEQLGTSGSGNHFVEFGALTVNTEIDTPLGQIAPGKYLALLSHSGSRRLGMEIANHYTDIAMRQRSGLPKDFRHLAWLDLDQEAGAEYWAAMQLAGKYASANHAVIHRRIIDALRMPVLGGIENHHNFAWKELVDGQELIVHRKGATPAGENVLGVIPGSMSAPGYVVRGRGNPQSISSAAHGAGRRMSRGQAKRTFDWENVKRKLKQQGVELISAGLDEAPDAYKDIRQVMADQADLVVALAEFQPKLVKMASGNERPED
jgi:tRNA-splicing ligase RtcB